MGVPRRAADAGIPTSSRSSPRPFLAAASPDAVPWNSIGSTICDPTVLTGLSAFIAPWKTIAMSVHRWERMASSPPAQDVLAVHRDAARRPPRWAAGVPSVPAAPWSCRTRTRRPGRGVRPRRVEAHALHGVQRAAVRQVEPHVEVAHLQQAHAAGPSAALRRRARGTGSASCLMDRCATPQARVQRILDRLSHQVAADDDERRCRGRAARTPTTRPASSPCARRRARASCPTRSPGTPTPRNASADSSKMAYAIVRTVVAISSGATWGRTCWNTMRRWLGAQRARPLHVDALADALHLRAHDARRRWSTAAARSRGSRATGSGRIRSATTIISTRSGMTKK